MKVCVPTVAAALLSLSAGCGQTAPTRAEFVQHGLDMSTTINGDEEQELWRGWFACVFDQVEDDADMLRDFAAASALDDLSPESSLMVNTAIRECLADDGTATGG